MAEHSKIEWTDATWNIITGCSVISDGCKNCYAMRLAGGRMQHHPSRAGLTQPSKRGPVWTGEVRFNEEWLDQPLRWRKPRMIFVCAHGDLFHENVPDEWLDRIWAVMALCPQHIFQVLTKRPDRAHRYLTDKSTARSDGRGDAVLQLAAHHGFDWSTIIMEGFGWPLRNVWMGVSAEDQPRLQERWWHLRRLPAALRWLSCEPLLGSLDFSALSDGPELGLDWVVVGGESGPGARPMHPEWARSIRDQCAAAGVPFFFKQWGEWAPGEAIAGAPSRTEETATWFADRWDFERVTVRMSEQMHRDDAPDLYRIGKKRAGDLLDGRQHHEWPEIAA